jgi:hypothetical protein
MAQAQSTKIEELTVEEIRAKVAQMRKTLTKMEKAQADPRALGSMRSKLLKIEAELKERDEEAGVGDVEDTGEASTEVAEAQAHNSRISKHAKRVSNAEDRKTRKREKSGAATTATTVTQSPVVPYCLCGCGRGNNAKRLFVQGHDARMKGYISRVEKGTMSVDDLSEYTRGILAQAAEGTLALDPKWWTISDGTPLSKLFDPV